MKLESKCSSIKLSEQGTNLNYVGKEKSQWRDASKKIVYDKNSIALFNGLTEVQDQLIVSALRSLGEDFVALPIPDFDSFQKGKAFGNRGQCNPTYFTVGNLVKYLQELQQETKLSSSEIVQKYFLVTAGGCGPCRFGMYITEYKKALRDAGFEGFRVTSFEHNKGIFQDTSKELVNYSPKFFVALVKAVSIGDIINIMGYKIRPYECEKGATDKAMNECRSMVSEAFEKRKNLTLALLKCRKIMQNIEQDRREKKVKVMVMGEFWAAMTEGDGNYNLHRFLESEGAECLPQPMINRLLLSIWEANHELEKSISVENYDAKSVDFTQMKTKIMIQLAKSSLLLHFKIYSWAIGLKDYDIPNMEKLSNLAKAYYPLDSSGGEGFLEVAHLIESVKENLADLVISVKPFGCMPSSSVSDGIQSLITNRFPSSNFLAIETSGEGGANFYSRVQMALFKAKENVS
ncbi:MAG: Activator of (R)-2-hydroxyglutaryl-CoA dehydratase [uncultured Sulfurovum sp.]|uniref:Activator of (R)-2-hydroxyglutaryl-CoA dehydratase n=1 Tax=uncultured Sulfurovum sp. TaxID=269237 RepID=A0A6S6S571_9BACT|nr:MAG: Activator of (R)-2-hydroxyglutaryl-CoA dehydratase [uncultured Sulfurovum sp.]